MAEKRKRGRPKKIGLYSPAIARELCEKLSEGIPLREICRKPGMPAWQTVYDWMNRYPDLAAAIQNARDIGCDNLAEECLSIADNLRLGTVETVDKDGNLTVKTEDMLGHRRLQIDTRLKLLAKFNPKKYGDVTRVTGVEGGAPITTEDLSATRLMDVIRNLEMNKRAG